MSSPNSTANSMSVISDGSFGGDLEYPSENGLRIHGNAQDLEKVYDYEAGGHHPVHLGDVLHQRYKIIHKLGSGGLTNVWLCCDTSTSESGPCYVALKIIMAEVSAPNAAELQLGKLIRERLGNEPVAEFFCFFLDQFEINGPNGMHYAFVYPVLGPRVSDMPETKGDVP